MTSIRSGSSLFVGTPIVQEEHTTHESVNVDEGRVQTTPSR